MREGTEGSKKRPRGGADRRDVRDDPVNDTRERKKRETVAEERRKRMLRKRSEGEGADRRGARDSTSDTRERKRRESVTETRQKRMLRKRSREGG